MSVRLLVGCVIAVVLLAYFLVVRPFEGALADRNARLDAARERVDARGGLAQQLDAADRERAMLDVRLARYRLDAPAPELVARFLRAANAAATQHATEIRGLDAEPATPRTGTPPFEELPFRLTVRGSYPALLATVRALVASPVASRIALDALAPEDRPHAGAPVLDATVNVVLLRLASPSPAPTSSDARTRPR